MSTFWANNILEPKRSFRFLMEFAGPQMGATIASYYVKSSSKPNFQMEGGPQVKYIQHTFKYPGRVMWQDITVTIVDPASPDAAAVLMNVLAGSGYHKPDTDLNSRQSISKFGANNSLGGIKLRQIDDLGNDIEEWNLWNPYISTVNFGELSYDSDDIVNYQLTIVYDYATLLNSVSSTAVAPGVRTEG